MVSSHISTERIYHSVQQESPRQAYLSILDSSVANYTTCGAIFVFPYTSTPYTDSTLTASSSHSPPPAYAAPALRASLGKALDIYPQWTGTLRLVHYDPASAYRDHRKPFGRVELLWGSPDDPGVELSFWSRPDSISSISPAPPSSSGGKGRVKDGKTVNRELFISPSSIIRLRSPTSPALPAMGIRVTYCSDGVVIGVGLHHSLGDATTLMRFMKDWSALHRAMISSAPPPAISRTFEPGRLDAYASPGIDSDREDEDVHRRAMEIPQLRYDFWASNEDRPSIISSPGHPDPAIAHLDEAAGKQRGKPIPWSTWDWAAPVVDYLLVFSPADLAKIYDSVCPAGTSKGISRLDALLGHLWRLITRARQVPASETVYLDMSLGVRSRLTPSLPDDFLGSPLTNISPSLSSSVLHSSPLNGAMAIRDAISLTIPRLPDLLHHEAHALDPIREWNAFMGSRHLMVTSWLGLGASEVTFEPGTKWNGWMHADMWPVDGLMVLMDRSSAPARTPGATGEKGGGTGNIKVQNFASAGTSTVKPEKGSGEPERNRRWYDEGVVVRLVLQPEVMERLLADEELWLDGGSVS